MDEPGGYRGGNYMQYISPSQLKKMKKNMKKVPIIQSKSDNYHQKEEEEAEELLSKIHENNKK